MRCYFNEIPQNIFPYAFTYLKYSCIFRRLTLRINSPFFNFPIFVIPGCSDRSVIKAQATYQREPSWFTFTLKATEQKIPQRQNFALQYNTQSQFHESASWDSERPTERKQPWRFRLTLSTCLSVFIFGTQHLKFVIFLDEIFVVYKLFWERLVMFNCNIRYAFVVRRGTISHFLRVSECPSGHEWFLEHIDLSCRGEIMRLIDRLTIRVVTLKRWRNSNLRSLITESKICVGARNYMG